ncbi:flavin-binding monooxygenase-like family protein [Sporormia fimetaria CBS 119925]|uniref:Flavin-binding monooxygenase-like family protein n=1 Tax=Sporormia fimetaria CBS 119925 TaxID=1340428 RepID=A0A6A6V3I3_9PLEO|nr:flavin-binding monooxygenase-like family protein [Sporormia fimetaria CBS 119925]
MGSFNIDSEKVTQIFARYEEEKLKRVKSEGMDQYVDIGKSEKFKHFANDPSRRQPIPFARMSRVGWQPRQSSRGFKPNDFVFIDSAWGFGGTWYWNRYPGLMCDVESACYMPLVEETGFIPKHRYSYGPELREYAERVAEKWQLRRGAVFGSTVKSTTWSDEKSEWETTITRRLPDSQEMTFKVRSDYFILASGILNRPKLARLDGIGTFQGHMFHTSRWDYAYTGGSPEDPAMPNLVGKKVAFIGTGATAVQAIPQLAKFASQLYVFQRTPSAISERGQRTVDPEDFKRNVQVGQGWQRSRRENMAMFLSNYPELPSENLVDDGWTHFPSFSGLVGGPRTEGLSHENARAYVEYLHQLDLPRQEGIRQNIKSTVKDQATAESLQPWYAGWCKRPCFHDEYLPTFNLPRVQLVDTAGKGISGFNERGVVFNGTFYDADVVILGTGFEPYSVGSPAFRASITVTGRGGLSMDDKWAQSPHTLHGVITRDFPNLMIPGFTQGPATVNVVHCMDVLARHAAHMITMARMETNAGEGDNLIIEPTARAEEDWALKIAGKAYGYAAISGCTPSYGNAEGSKVAKTPEQQLRMAKGSPWSSGIVDFTRMIEAWEAKGDLAELDIKVVRYNSSL